MFRHYVVVDAQIVRRLLVVVRIAVPLFAIMLGTVKEALKRRVDDDLEADVVAKRRRDESVIGLVRRASTLLAQVGEILSADKTRDKGAGDGNDCLLIGGIGQVGNSDLAVKTAHSDAVHTVDNVAPMVCVANGLSKAEKKMAKAFEDSFAARFVFDWSDDATHVVTGSDFVRGDGVTFEFFLGQLNKCKLVPMRWVRACVATGQLEPTDDYEQVMVAESSPPPTVTHCRSLFLGYHFYISQLDTSRQLSRNRLERFVQLTGATVHALAETMVVLIELYGVRRDRCFVVFPYGSRRRPLRVAVGREIERVMGLRLLDAEFIVKSVYSGCVDKERISSYIFPKQT